MLAKHVLAELPRQVTDYYKMQGIVPQPRPQPTQWSVESGGQIHECLGFWYLG